MKFFKNNSEAIETELDEEVLPEHIHGVDVKKVKQDQKENLASEKKGIGNTTNILGEGPKRCVGCGTVLQITNEALPGFVKDIEKQEYCFRCFRIKHYNRLVEQEIDDHDFVNILNDINQTPEKIRYYYVVDIFDLPGSRVKWLEDLIAVKEVVIVINKIDLIPKSVNKLKVMKYIKKFFEDSPIKAAKFILTSSVKLDYVYALLKELKSVNYDQYIVGISNAGKSSLINACLKENLQVPSIVTSKYVNTTLDKIKINFTEKNYVYDTPGLVKHHHIANATAPNYWDFFFFQKEIKQITYQLLPDQAIFYGGLAWFAFEESQLKNSETNKFQKTNFHFYVNKLMPLHRTKASNADNYFKKNRASLVPRVKDVKQKFETYNFTFDKEQSVDLNISGLGWINFKTHKGMKVSVTVPITPEGITVVVLPAMI